MTVVSGNIIYLFKRYITEKFGDAEFEKILNKLSDKNKAVLGESIISSKIYDVSVLDEMLSAFEDEYGHEEIMVGSKWFAEQQLKGLYGIVIKFATPEKVFRQKPKITKKIFPEGEFELKEFDEHYIKLRYANVQLSDIIMEMILLIDKAIAEIVLKTDVKVERESADDSTFDVIMRF